MIDFVELMKIIWKNRRIIILTSVLITIFSIYYAKSQKKIYEATNIFTSFSQDKQSGAFRNLVETQFSSITGLSDSKNNLDFTVIMSSRNFRLELIKDMKLYDYFIKINKINLSKLKKDKKPDEYDVAKWLEKIVKVTYEKNKNIYKVQVSLSDPVMAAKIANHYVVILENYIKNKTTTQSQRNRKYLEKQLEVIEKKLQTQEDELKLMEEKYNTISILEDAKASAELISKLKINIIELDTKLKIYGEFSGSENIQVRKLKKEMDVYLDQLNAIQSGSKDTPVSIIPFKDIPEIKKSIGKLQREIEITVSLYKMLLTQYETAKIDEVKEQAVVSVLDEAIVPKTSSKPNKKLIVLIGFSAGIFIGLFLAFFIEFLKEVDFKKIFEI